MSPLHAPPNEHEATELFAWVSVDHNGEGILGAQVSTGLTPLVYHHPRNGPLMREIAVKIARTSGLRIRLVRFKRDAVIEEIGG